ncbi:MAG: maltose alpha-D-glucosyltransferase [Acidobacteria bacterium SCN 69-37]|nr:MAG: maltose alpha-D-glucosyltransferase [Acidobacteria bacterium SCN 69-37]
MKRPGSMSDPLWFKDAIIYETHVKAFFDGNDDGVGDFPGLLQKLDYIQDLGVTCIWLLPFFPSPMRDDGYDIADYLNVHPDYGTMEDFQTFLAAAHERGLQVMIELVINHTSDQHPWFQRARQAPPGSPERDFYVWSDTDQRYAEARIIFTDTEHSNWTWDPIAKAYFWHRFFSHQPDLNYDNPQVVEEVLAVMRYWLDMGVDGLRLDAIPYLIERDGTNCENLPETHVIIRRIREEMDRGYAGRMILAEANQWPTDVRPYFGDGDECHMAFHFPLMPRIFMALRLEDRLPITDIMGQTPDIPGTCQWGLFLRNHDELTLEMVSDAERDYMYMAYSADPKMRINVGIRRRLAPLMDNNRRRIELLNSLLFSFPGTPILYYGDEIGMGDNIYLGDRNGVRTPMQWNADRNGGFSRATPGRLYQPVVMDPVYGYAATNVEAQQSDASSLLHWMRNMIALRKLFRVFGRGSFEALHPANRKVLAYVRRFDGETVLCVANLSRFAQPVELDLAAFDGLRPVEMIGYVEFPPITRRPYPLTLGPYGFLWFELQAAAEPADTPDEPDQVRLQIDGWADLFEGRERDRLETQILPRFLPAQRWFGGKGRAIARTRLVDWAPLEGTRAAVLFVEILYADAGRETYGVPVAITFDPVALPPATATLAQVLSTDGIGLLVDALQDDAACTALLTLIEQEKTIASRHGVIRGVRGAGFDAARGTRDAILPAVRGAVEQSNTSVRFGDRLILKWFRRQTPGPNPDGEIGRYLTEDARFDRIPPFAGAIEHARDDADPATIALLQGLVVHQGDGWTWTLEELDRYYEASAALPFPPEAAAIATRSLVDLAAGPDAAVAHEHLGMAIEAAATLGRRTGELHAALATSTLPDFAPLPLDREALAALAASLRADGARVFGRLRAGVSTLPDDLVEQAGLVLARRRSLLARFDRVAAIDGHAGQRIRIHGDYHLGQVLRARHDVVILDFEGEPARAIAERRARVSPVKDLAGMVRSFSYAAWTGLLAYTTRRPDDLARIEPWARFWEQATSAAFLRGWRDVTAGEAFAPSDPDAWRVLLDAYLLDKALYELLYEIDNRPGWIRVPLGGILALEEDR